MEEGIFLTRYARKVTLVVRGDDFTCARTVADQVKKEDKIEVKFNTEILEAGGEHMVSYEMCIRDRKYMSARLLPWEIRWKSM